MGKSKNQTVFVFTIEILSDEWEYKKGQKINIPIKSNTVANAYKKLENYDGSEYPNYKVINIDRCDNFLFKPLI
jgi:hypothetical protein